MLSKNSKQQTLNNENSIISGIDNWIGNVSLEDSRQFEEHFSQLQTCKQNKLETKKELKTIPYLPKNVQLIQNIGLSNYGISKPPSNQIVLKANMNSNTAKTGGFTANTSKTETNCPSNKPKISTNEKCSEKEIIENNTKQEKPTIQIVNSSLPNKNQQQILVQPETNTKGKKKLVRPTLLNISEINNDEDYTEDLDEEVGLDLNKKVVKYQNDLNENKSVAFINNSMPSIPIKCNTSPHEQVSYNDYDLVNQNTSKIGVPLTNNYNFNLKDYILEENEEKNAPKEKEGIVDLKQVKDNNNNTVLKQNYGNIINSYATSTNNNITINFNNVNSINIPNQKSTNTNSINNYTSNCSTNLTNISSVSNPMNSLNTPKHQKITSDHNISAKPTANVAFSGVVNQNIILNYIKFQNQSQNTQNTTTNTVLIGNENTSRDNNINYYNTINDDTSVSKDSIYNSKSKCINIYYAQL